MKKKKSKKIAQQSKPTKLDELKTLYHQHAKMYSILAVVLLFVILFVVRTNSIRLKSQFHSDEIFSVMLSTCNDYYHSPLPNGEYTGEDLKGLIVKDNEGGLSGAFSDISQLWINNGDAPHASLYYMVLRIALIGFDSFDIHELAWRGGILNLMFFALSFFFMYKLLRRIFGDKLILILCGLALAFGNFMSIANTLLIREYQMAETGIIILTLIAVNLVIAFRENQQVSKLKYVLGFGGIIAYVVSLGYFNAIYVSLLGIALIVAAFRYNRKNWIPLFFLSALIAVAVAYALYPGFFNFLIHESVHKTRAFTSVKNIWSYLFGRDIIMNFFTIYGFVIFVVILIGVLVSKERKNILKSDKFLWLPMIVLLSMVIILYASVLKMPRYYYPLLPVLALIVPQLISHLPKSCSGYFDVLVVSYFAIIVCVFPVRVNYQWKPLSKELNHKAQIFNLNPNEVVQLIPCMNDTIKYAITNNDYIDINKDEVSYIVTKDKLDINNDSIQSSKKLVLGKHIYLYEFKYIPNVVK